MSELASEFDALRPHLTWVACGILGSLAEAEDFVQQAWLRLRRADAAQIEDLRAWLTTVVDRLSLDALGSARHRRESYVGEWLPEPVVEEGTVSVVSLTNDAGRLIAVDLVRNPDKLRHVEAPA